MKGWGRKLFQGIIDAPADGSSESLFTLFKCAIALILFVLLVDLALFPFVNNLGAWGDFFGGVLNPILTFFAFMGLLITISIQQKELKLTREELHRSADALEKQIESIDRQNFESTFFQMLHLHNTIVNSMDLRISSERIVEGRDCFNRFYMQLKQSYEGAQPAPELDRIRSSYQGFWRSHQQDLGHYFRFLYNIVRFVDENRPDDLKYIRILRSQLSDLELAILFYNCLTDMGGNFKIYVERYAILNNLPSSILIKPDHKELFSESAYTRQ